MNRNFIMSVGKDAPDRGLQNDICREVFAWTREAMNATQNISQLLTKIDDSLFLSQARLRAIVNGSRKCVIASCSDSVLKKWQSAQDLKQM